MPELPEVEAFRRFAEQHALNRPMRSVTVLRDKIVMGMVPDALVAALVGRRFQETYRHGKNLFVKISGRPSRWALLHFGMTGYLGFQDAQGQVVLNAYGDPTRPTDHVRVRFDFEDGSALLFHEQRMFGGIMLVDNPEAYIQAKRLGPDALSVDAETFEARLADRKGLLKPVLMDQAFVAGLGNVYVDEMLFQARLHPELPVNALQRKERRLLFRYMVEILEKTVAAGADREQLPKGYLLHDRSRKSCCPRDGRLLEMKSIGGRSTYFCLHCQPFR